MPARIFTIGSIARTTWCYARFRCCSNVLRATPREALVDRYISAVTGEEDHSRPVGRGGVADLPTGGGERGVYLGAADFPESRQEEEPAERMRLNRETLPPLRKFLERPVRSRREGHMQDDGLASPDRSAVPCRARSLAFAPCVIVLRMPSGGKGVGPAIAGTVRRGFTGLDHSGSSSVSRDRCCLRTRPPRRVRLPLCPSARPPRNSRRRPPRRRGAARRGA